MKGKAETGDKRRAASAVQEKTRIRAVRAVVEEGLSRAAACERYRVSRTALYNWLSIHKAKGYRGLRAKRRGAPSRIKLADSGEAAILSMVVDCLPRELANEKGERLAHVLWSWQAVRDLVRIALGIDISRATAIRYLERWGLWLPLKERRATSSPELKEWRRSMDNFFRQYYRRTTAWVDARSYTPPFELFFDKQRVPKKRHDLTLVTAVFGRGDRLFAVYVNAHTEDVFRDFQRRLTLSRKKTVGVIVAPHRIHNRRLYKLHKDAEFSTPNIHLYLVGRERADK